MTLGQQVLMVIHLIESIADILPQSTLLKTSRELQPEFLSTFLMERFSVPTKWSYKLVGGSDPGTECLFWIGEPSP